MPRRPKHTDPIHPRVRTWHEQEIITSATAPYNFVPLPHRIALIDEPLHQDSYKDNGLTGYIECKITTESPTYIRGMLDIEHYRQLQGSTQDVLDDPREKERQAKFFSTSQDERDGLPLPSIPGSSLRGMLRNLVEIVSYSWIHAVADDPQIWYRDLARNGAMSASYERILGAYGAKVRAGILSCERDRWYVEPAQLPQGADGNLCEKPYCKVDDRKIQESSGELPGFKRLYQPGYKLQKQPYKVRFSVRKQQVHGQEENIVTQIARFEDDEQKYDHTGFLICTGNMGDNGRRRYYPVVFGPTFAAENGKIPIEEDAVKLYKHNLTDQLNEDLGSDGCLHVGNFVFFIPPANPEGEIIYFGHNPYFRVPLKNGSSCASPRDYCTLDEDVPKGKVDYVEAIFGADLDADAAEQNLGPAGRISFMNAEIDREVSSENIWYRQPPRPEAPKILASPKATAYAHYLVQDGRIGTDLGLSESHNHHPDGDKKGLANYSTPLTETEIRGHKLYWAKGSDPDYIASEEDLQNRERTLTRVITLNKGVVFKAKIKFRNLREEELGALLWALILPGEDGNCRHRIGMGKPLGMGVIHIEPELYISDHAEQYKKLFDCSGKKVGWFISRKNCDTQRYIECFERAIKKQILPERLQRAPLSGVKRIEDLLRMLSWQPQVTEAWREETEYMELGSFKELAVLPTPKHVLQCARQRSQNGQRRHIHQLDNQANYEYLKSIHMKEIDLLAIVLDLRAYIEKPAQAANWYGRAAQSLVYECIGNYDLVYADQLHKMDEERKPFTTTTLIGSFPKGKIVPQKLYSLRISGLNKPIEEIFLRAIQAGGYFGIGSVVELDKIPFIIEGVYWDNHDHRLACHSNYAALHDVFLREKALCYDHIRFDFQKCPVLIQHGEVYNPLITPEIIYRSLLRKWQNHSPIPLEDFSADFLNDGLFVSAYKLESQPIQQEGLVMGGKGYIDVTTKYAQDQTWATLQMLAAFAFYSGIGKNTTRGFGQTTVELW